MKDEFTDPYDTTADAVEKDGSMTAAKTCDANTKGKTYVNDNGTTFYVSTCFDDSSDAMFNTFMVE